MELGKLSDLLDLLRASGVTSYKNGDLELKLDAAPALTSAREEIIEQAKKSEQQDKLDKMGLYAKMFTHDPDGATA